MKRISTIFLCICLSIPFVGCSQKKTVKFGAGVYVGTPTATSATKDAEGTGKGEITVAAVTLNTKGAIVSCDLDAVEYTVKYDKEGTTVSNETLKTKKELGSNYGMVAYGGATKEWFEQAASFEKVVVGKTLEQVKTLLTADNKGNSEVIKAGCTIAVNGFVFAVEKACNQANDSQATANCKVKVALDSSQTVANATSEKNGENKIETTLFAAALNQEGKVVAAFADCVEMAFPFTNKGESTFDSSQKFVTKKEAGANYGMVAYGGASKEWYQQAQVFENACIGKNGKEIAAMQGTNGKGTEELISAGCTINVSGFVKAAGKIDS